MLSAIVLAGLVAAPLSTFALFLPARAARHAVGAWPWARRLVLALIGTIIVGGAAAAVLLLIGTTRSNLIAALAALGGISLLWLPFTRRWNARGHLCWATTTFLFAGYLVFMWDWTFASQLGTVGTTGALILLLLEAIAALMGCAYLWELCDALGREDWRRRIQRGARATTQTGDLPFVSLHVPAYNEPPDMLIETLTSLTALDYPAFEVVAIDDNTEDEALWRPVEAWCAGHGVAFVHLENHPGYKSGALNYALSHATDPRAELIGVVDSDYQLDPQFLRRCAPLFADPVVGFIQAPQDYRDWQTSAFFRRLYYSYSYFFAVSQPSRNERDGAIFAGTMGLIRRRALEEVGGWDEWCITEDAELSLRLMRRGWSGLHVDESFGKGVMPLTFEALKGQRFRWCFGGIQILRRHWRSMMPGRRTEQNAMDLGQRWAYLSGALQWYGDLLGLIFFLFLLAGAVNVALGGGLLFRKLTGFLLAAIPLLVGMGLIRAVALLRRATGATWRDALGAFLIWQSTAVVTARASVQALFAKEAEFLRTPKTSEDARAWDAVRGNRSETLLALLGLAGMAAALSTRSGYGALTAALLAWPTVAFCAAPLNSLAAQRAALTPELRERRRTEALRSRRTRHATAAVGGLALAAGAAATIIALLSPGPAPVSPPQLVGPARGTPAPYHSSSPGASPTTSPTGTTSTSGAPTSSPSSTTSATSPASSSTSTSSASPTSSPTRSTP